MRDRSDTYFSRAVAEADMAGGRFARIEASRVTGVPRVPALPVSSPWSHDPVPNEAPLGFCIDAIEPVGTAKEIEQSIQLGGPPSEGSGCCIPAGGRRDYG
jgi:hypothetical protein